MKKYFIILLFLFVPLYGCVPAVFLVGATAGGAVIYDRRNLEATLHDKHITQTIVNLISDDAELHNKVHINIATFHSVVLLVGQAPSPELRDRVYQLASEVKGIRRVYNEITIEQPISFGQRTNDEWINTKVKTSMLAQKGLKSSQIKVITENRVVYLMGIVSHQQADLATEVARRVSDVQKVVRVFEYK